MQICPMHLSLVTTEHADELYVGAEEEAHGVV